LKSLLILFLLHITLLAHPHTFIDVHPTIKVEDGTTTSIHFKWVFDEMTSAMLIMDVDTNGDGKISTKESSTIYSNYFISLEDYGFYTHIKLNSKEINLPEPKNFKASVENNRLCYSFEIPGSYEINKTLFEFGDVDLYVAMVLKKEFVTVSGAEAKISDLENDTYFGYTMELK